MINGSRIRNRSISAVKLRTNSITGREVNEDRLGRVPSASTAVSARTAGSADALSGIAVTEFLQGFQQAAGDLVGPLRAPSLRER